MSNKRKDIMNTSLMDSESQKPKATWDLETTKHFIQAYLDQVYKNECNGTALTKKCWKVIISKFNEKWKAI